MRYSRTTTSAFFALLRAGLWEQGVRLSPYGPIDFTAILCLSEEQSVEGLIAAGLNHVVDNKPSKRDVIQLIGKSLQLEQRNAAMNGFIAEIVDKMRDAGIYTLLIKGQGVAQCYERPLWRACGDVDLFLNEDNYRKAKDYLTPLANSIDQETEYNKHIGMTIEPWVVELHGNLRSGLSARLDRVLDEIMDEVFLGGEVRTWMNGETQVFLPGVNVDIIYVFTHILTHFYKGGIGVRQICDWCRLLWTSRDSINVKLLEQRLQRMKLVAVWKAFGSFAIDYLGMPQEAMPLYSPGSKWKRKADRICSFVIEVGNFGHNRDMSYYNKYPFLVRKVISFSQRLGDIIRHARVLPMESIRFIPSIVFNGMKSAFKREG